MKEPKTRAEWRALEQKDFRHWHKLQNKIARERKITLEVALKEADRCRRYADPVLNETIIVVLADEVKRLQKLLDADRVCTGPLPF